MLPILYFGRSAPRRCQLRHEGHWNQKMKTIVEQYDLTRFDTTDMMRCRSALRNLRESGDGSMESVARKVVDYFYESLRGADGQRGTVLVRMFKTHPYDKLDPGLQAYAHAMMRSGEIPGTTQCLTLLASRGIEGGWNSRNGSKGHKSIPLLSEAMILKAPMIARLVEQMGIPIPAVLTPDKDFVLKAQETTFNVFHVEEAAGSPYVPAQETFVLPFGVRSVLGFGGLLPSGQLFATIIFSRVPIPSSTAKLFAPLSLNVKLCLLPFDGGTVFE